MPPITRWFIKTALAHFVAALALGVALAALPGMAASPAAGSLRSVYFHLLMVGWVAQLIFGVAYWMFPRRSAEAPRGSELLAWATYALLNAGLVARALAEPMDALAPRVAWAWLLAVAAALQWLAGLGFVVNTWGRIKER